MTVPIYNKDYYTGITAPYIDWIAGGNFDGYLIRKVLLFHEVNREVELRTIVIHKTYYDGNVNDTVLNGTYTHTDKDTLTLTFDSFEMRGKILGDKKQFIAFSVWNKISHTTEVYTLGEDCATV